MGLILLLFAAGLALVVCEIFVPGGIIGMIGLTMMATAIFLCFHGGNTILGIVLLVLALVAVPLVIVRGLRRLALKSTQTREDGYSASETGIENLVGLQGVSLSTLRPAGTARINDRKLSVVTRGEMIYPKTQIEVVEVEGNRVVVRAVRAE